MTKIILTLAAIACASPALAQTGWNSNQLGDYTYYRGTGSNSGWSGSSNSVGDFTYHRFNGPNGQTQNCTSNRVGDFTYTRC